jgi:DNA repair protein RecO (recombination protein O)
LSAIASLSLVEQHNTGYLRRRMAAQTITDAIVVRVVDYGESDRVATLLTRAVGKVSALARGARRSRKRFGGALEPFGAGQAVLSERRGELWALESFDARRGFPRLALDVAKVAHAAYLCELARELVPEHAPDERIFALVEEALSLLDGGEPHPSLLRAFELKLLDAVGLQPALDTCVSCGDAVPAAGEGEPGRGELVDVRRGGVVCARCAAGEASVRPTARLVSGEARRALIAAGRAPLDRARAIDWGAGAEAARDLLQALLAEHLPRPLRSVEFIAKLNRARG